MESSRSSSSRSGEAVAEESGSGNGLVYSVKHALKTQAEASRAGRSRRRPTIFRVRPGLEEHYFPPTISLGLFDRSDYARTRANKFRVELVSAFLETVGMTEENWDELCAEVVNEPDESRELYDADQDSLSDEEIRTALTLDAMFLACYLGSCVGFPTPRSRRLLSPRLHLISNLIRNLISEQGHILLTNLEYDFLRLENQIPLHVLRNALLLLYRKIYDDNVDDSDCVSDAMDHALRRICKYVADLGISFSGFASLRGRYLLDDPSEHEHLLAAMHHRVCGGSKLVEFGRREQEYIHIPCATMLCAAGIKFRGNPNPDGYFEDVKFSTTACGLIAIVTLPMLDGIYDNSIDLWKSLVAYEEGSNINECKFMNYLNFMDDIIDTESDVPLLMIGQHPVIRLNCLGDDKAAVKVFNSMLKNHMLRYTSPTWIELRNNINKFYHQRYRRLFYEGLTIYFEKPWQTLSVVAAIILLGLTILQTIYTVLPYYKM